jgi:hypothetical protein
MKYLEMADSEGKGVVYGFVLWFTITEVLSLDHTY